MKNEVIKYIQGDVILTRVDSLPENLKKIDCKEKILQMSEVTGHHHHFKPEAEVELFVENKKRDIKNLDNLFTTITPDEGKYITVEKGSELYHGKSFEYNPAKSGTGDHVALTIPPGVYKVDIVREFNYDFMEVRRVVD